MTVNRFFTCGLPVRPNIRIKLAAMCPSRPPTSRSRRERLYSRAGSPCRYPPVSIVSIASRSNASRNERSVATRACTVSLKLRVNAMLTNSVSLRRLYSTQPSMAASMSCCWRFFAPRQARRRQHRRLFDDLPAASASSRLPRVAAYLCSSTRVVRGSARRRDATPLHQLIPVSALPLVSALRGSSYWHAAALVCRIA